MKVRELIEKLQEVDQELVVIDEFFTSCSYITIINGISPPNNPTKVYHVSSKDPGDINVKAVQILF